MLHLGLSADEARDVSHLLESPISRTQAEKLTEEFLATVRRDEDKRDLLDRLHEPLAHERIHGLARLHDLEALEHGEIGGFVMVHRDAGERVCRKEQGEQEEE